MCLNPNCAYKFIYIFSPKFHRGGRCPRDFDRGRKALQPREGDCWERAINIFEPSLNSRRTNTWRKRAYVHHFDPRFSNDRHQEPPSSHSLLDAFLAQTRVSVFLDPASLTLKISIATVHSLEIPSIFIESGHLTCFVSLAIPTIGGCYHSRLGLIVGCGLAADLVLGFDWIDACRPTLTEDQSAILCPSSMALCRLTPPHRWHPFPGLSVAFS